MGRIIKSRKTLSVFDAVAITTGIVIGTGIFKTPSIVAADFECGWVVLFVWLLGGVISFIGALCYAELTTTFPHAGGEYHYLTLAFGRTPAFLFAWARMTVIQTGSIAMLAFLIGNYASEVFSLGAYSASLYAGLTIVILTSINIAGISQGKWIQNILITIIVIGLLSVAAAGFSLTSTPINMGAFSFPTRASLGKAMIFILLTYGGWNEAAYLSAEVHNAQRSMIRVLYYSIGLITAVYMITNFVFLKGLGLSAMSGSEVVAADLMRKVLGEWGAKFISLLIVIAALGTMNAVIITGSRTNYALGQDFAVFSFLGHWQERRGTPVNALLVQVIIALVLVILGTGTRGGFVMMVEYTAPVFWFFFLLVGISIFVLRQKEKNIYRPFKVPFYPITPILFCGVCIYMLHSSLSYTGKGALLGLIVLAAGIPFLLLKFPYSFHTGVERR